MPAAIVHRGVYVCQSWSELVKISLSYDQNKFSIVFLNKKWCNQQHSDQIWKGEQKVSCSALFGGFRMLDFLVHPSWAPVANFCRKTARSAVFRQKLATGAHDGWTKKSSMPNPPNNEEHDTFCSLFQIWSKLMYRIVDGELNIAFNKKIREILTKCWNNAFSRCPERITWWISSPRVLTFGILFFLS